MKKIGLLLLLCLFSVHAFAFKIVATVDDEIITDVDVQERQDLLKNIFNMESSFKEVLNALIEEKVKLVAAQRAQISVSADQLKDGVRYLEGQNGMEEGTLLRVIREKKLSEMSLFSQLKADLGWVAVVSRNVQSQPKITKKQIANSRAVMKKELLEGRYLLAEIFIPFDDNEDAAEQEAQMLFNRIVDEEESFTDLAVQYSKGKTASLYGDLGWVKPSEMEKAIADVVRVMKNGQLSKPIKGKKGYTLILMRDSQPPLESDMQEVWQVSQFVTPKENYEQIKDSLEKAASSCMAFTQYAAQYGVEGSHSGAMPEMLALRIPEDLKGLLQDKPIGELVGPVDMGPYAVFVMKCGVRTTSVLPDDETIKQQLIVQEMEKKSQELLVKEKKRALIKKK